jgi:LPS-assembly lipoprotein|tara:strand:+ start:869 stop:1399 length:531 start_codon:yes stop_codon:yes gene_type:complete
MKKLTLLVISILLTSVVTAGCGWHLRNNDTIQIMGNIGQVHLDGDQNSQLYRSVAKALKSSNVIITEIPREAEIIIRLTNQSSTSRTASVSSSARVSELEARESVDIMILTGDGNVLLKTTTISKEKVFKYNEDNVSTNDEEHDMLTREMVKDLSSTIIRRLNATLRQTEKNEHKG